MISMSLKFKEECLKKISIYTSISFLPHNQFQGNISMKQYTQSTGTSGYAEH